MNAHGGLSGAVPFPIYADAGDDRYPAVAAIPTTPNQGQYLIVWQSPWSGDNTDIYGRRVRGDGTAVGPIIWIPPTGGKAVHPAAGGNEAAREYLVAWNEVISPPNPYSGVRARRASLDGELTAEQEWLWWFWSDHLAVVSGPVGDFLTALQSIGADWGVYGRFWGNRTYVPLVTR